MFFKWLRIVIGYIMSSFHYYLNLLYILMKWSYWSLFVLSYFLHSEDDFQNGQVPQRSYI